MQIPIHCHYAFSTCLWCLCLRFINVFPQSTEMHRERIYFTGAIFHTSIIHFDVNVMKCNSNEDKNANAVLSTATYNK